MSRTGLAAAVAAVVGVSLTGCVSAPLDNLSSNSSPEQLQPVSKPVHHARSHKSAFRTHTAKTASLAPNGDVPPPPPLTQAPVAKGAVGQGPGAQGAVGQGPAARVAAEFSVLPPPPPPKQ
jgi:hypothetical protein